MYSDPTGHFVITATVTTFIIWGIVALFTVATVGLIESQTHFMANTFNMIGNALSNINTEWWDELSNSSETVQTSMQWISASGIDINAIMFGNIYFAKSKGKKGRPGIKKKGKEGLNKNRNKPGFKQKVTPRPQEITDTVSPQAHVPSKKGHRKFDPRNNIWWLIFMLLGYSINDEE